MANLFFCVIVNDVLEIIKKVSIEKLFLIISLIFGLLYVFILPPFQSVDEGMHFFRTYQISEGNFVAKNINNHVGDTLPTSLSTFYNHYVPFIKNIDKKIDLKEIKNSFKFPLNENIKTFTEFANTALYSPVCYISQLPGVILAKMMKMPLALIFYFGRLCNLIFYCLLVYFALKITPFFKMPMFLLALMPMSLSLGSAFTCDVMVLGLNFLWFALILKIMTNPVCDNKIFLKNLIIMSIFAFLISITKSYILLIPLIFLIPKGKFKTLKQYSLFMVSIVFFACLGFLIWSFQCKGLSLNMNTVFANSAAQILFIKTHPLKYIGILTKTFFVKTPRLLITMIGVLGWQDTKLDWLTYIIYPFLIYFAVFSDNFNYKTERWQKYIILITIVVGTILTYTSLYIMWSPVGNNVILGLNGKYFIPVVLPLLLFFKNGIGKLDYEKIKFAIIVCVILVLFSSDLSLLHRFYNITPQLYYKI